MYDELVATNHDLQMVIRDEADMRMRNPKNDDLGDVLHIGLEEDHKEQLLENYHLYDGKEFLVQKVDPDYFVSQVDAFTLNEAGMVYNILVREFKPETWEFGPTYEVQIDKMITCDKLADFLQANLFPHIPLNFLFGTKVNIAN